MNATFIETDCTFVHDGRTFESGGAFVSDTHLIAYPAADGVLADWHGNAIGTWREVSHWTQPGAWGCPKVYAIRATVDGATYHGRGFGIGMILRGKRVAAELN